MSKDMPWVDIYPASVWDEYVVQYEKGNLSFNADKFGRSKFGLGLRKAFKLGKQHSRHNEFLTMLGIIIKGYHGVEKPQANTLTLRANMLDSIVLHIESYMKQEGLSREDTSKNTLSYLLLKLARRAKRKAAYVRELKKHTDSHDKGFKGYDDLMAYIFKPRDQDEDLVALQPDVLMERLDPWHRVFEMKLNNLHGDGSSYMDGALKLWICNKQAHDTPFFVWLEGNYVCTGDESDGTKRLNYAQDINLNVKNGVTYLSGGTAMPLLIFFSGGRAYPAMAQTNNNLLPMEKCPVPSKHPGAYAYVWTKDKLLLCGNHAPGSFHHSSFTSGSKVRCAGMIQFEGGKVSYLSNDSGHYHPGSRHLRNLAEHLQGLGALSCDCLIEDFSQGRKELRL